MKQRELALTLWVLYAGEEKNRTTMLLQQQGSESSVWFEQAGSMGDRRQESNLPQFRRHC